MTQGRRADRSSQASSRYGLTPILIFERKGQEREKAWQGGALPTGSYSQVKSKRMEIKFGMSAVMRPQPRDEQREKDKKEKEEKEKERRKSGAGLQRGWSFRLPKLSRGGERGETKEVEKSKEAGRPREEERPAVRPPRAPRPAPPVPAQSAQSAVRAWVGRLNSHPGTELEVEEVEVVEDGEEEVKLEVKHQNPAMEKQMKELYCSPLYHRSPAQEEDEIQKYEEEREEELANAREADCDLLSTVEEEEEEDLESVIIHADALCVSDSSEEQGSRSRRSGSILKHPGQKRTHIKHVEFLDLINTDQRDAAESQARYF